MTEPTTAEIVHAIEYTITQQSPRTIAVRIADLEGKLKALEAKSCGEDNAPEDCISHVLKAELDAAEQTIKEIIPYLHHHDNCQSYIERGGERDPCDCGLEAILNPSPPRS